MTAGLMLAEAERASPIEALDDDARMMAAALNLARRGLGRVAPNPTVAALIVKDGAVIGRGVTGFSGRPHAETSALQMAADKAKGATLYVTLEPCSHHGQTPPCADAIISAGIARVVSAMEDPDPRVSGQGHARLRAAGIELRTCVLAGAATRLNLGHILRVTRSRPMLTLKLAETADGYAAGAAGAPRLMITGAPANAYVHMQRTLYDAILIGSGTALTDDPLLSIRLPGLEALKPLRIVLDSTLALKADSRLAATALEYPTLVLTSETASPEAVVHLAEKGIEVVRIAQGAAGHVDLASALTHLAQRGLTRIFCEGGPQLAAALMRSGFADEIILLTSQTVLGAEGLAALDPASRARLNDPAHYSAVEERMFGQDRVRRYERRV